MAQVIHSIVCEIGNLSTQIDAARASITSLLAVAPKSLAQRLDSIDAEAFVRIDDAGDLLGAEAVNRSAFGALKLHGFEIKPSDMYLELVAAVTGDGHAHLTRIAHGWPVLARKGEIGSASADESIA